jgi:diguanylate cyclase (GGDEF)-like protein
MVDVDKFKAVNDTHGHQKGDEVLRAIAERLEAVVAGKGSVYRYGGEEFTIVLPNHTTDEGVAVAERARRVIEATKVGGLSVTASFGVATFPEQAMELGALLAAADAALYDAKNRGRNLVRTHEEGDPPTAVAPADSRKLPTSGALTEGERAAIRQSFYTQGCARCPKDDAKLELRESKELGVKVPRVHVWCKLCGLAEWV